MRMLLAVANVCQVPNMQLTLHEGLVYVPELNSHNNCERYMVINPFYG